MKQTISNREKLFNPKYTFNGDPTPLLKDKPLRSKNLERFIEEDNVKLLNKKFVKDGYMYLLRGAKNGQETGFYSKLYSEGKTIESEYLDPVKVAAAQSINGNTPFLSATTDLYVAGGFANNERIYVLKIPVEDVYRFATDNSFVSLEEEEYLIPDFISQEEIVRSFRYDKFKGVYHYLAHEVGLEITPADLGEYGNINQPDMDRIELSQHFNNSASFLDSTLEILQQSLLSMKLSDEFQKRTTSNVKEEKNKRRIALFTDAHGLLEPTQAILEDIKMRGITEVYSLGDNIGLGPNPGEVMDLLEEYKVKSIQGNYEDMICFGAEPFWSYLSSEKYAHLAWMKEKLNDHQIKNIKTYPHAINLFFAGKNIALVHFANDVRCDFLEHDSWGYKRLTEDNRKASFQFRYTNSKEQLLELAAMLNYELSDELLKRNSSDIWKVLKMYVHMNQQSFKEDQRGVLSYLEDPIFTHDGTLLSITDFDAIFQGHVHFEIKDKLDDTDIYTLRAVGMGYKEMQEKEKAVYTILEENEEEKMTVQRIEVPFDREKMGYAICHAELPNEDIKRYTLS